MAAAELRITHATTGAEAVFDDVAFRVADLVRDEAEDDGERRIAAVDVYITSEDVLGVTLKPLPAGRHRALLTVAGDEHAVVVDGVLSDTGARHGRAYAAEGGDVRQWTLRVEDDAIERVWEELEAVLLAEVAGACEAGGGTLRSETTVDGEDMEPFTAEVAWWDWGELVRCACAHVGIAVEEADEALTYPARLIYPYGAGGAVRTVDARAFLVDGDRVALTTAGGAYPDWTGAEALEGLAEEFRLRLAARYAPYPQGERTLRVERGGWDEPDTGTLPDLTPLLEDYEWATEPADHPDLAVVVGQLEDRISGSYWTPPEVARYAAAVYRTRTETDDDGTTERVVANRSVLDLPVHHVGLDGAFLEPETSGGSDGAYAGQVLLGRPVVWRGGVSVASLQAGSAGDVYAVGYREPDAPAPGLPYPRTHELWAAGLFPRFALVGGSVMSVSATVSRGAVEEANGGALDVAVSDPARGFALEGVAWAVRALAENADTNGLDLELYRPGGGFTGIAEPPPFLAPVVTSYHAEYTYENQAGEEEVQYYVHIRADVPAESSTPDDVEWEVVSGPGSGLSPLAGYGPRTLVLTDDSPGLIGPITIRFRAVYNVGITSAWVEHTTEGN
jgi:hypothetical protein